MIVMINEMMFHDDWFDDAYDPNNENEIESYTMNGDKIYDMSCESSKEFYNLRIKKMKWLKSSLNIDSRIVKMNHEREFKERQNKFCDLYISELNVACDKSRFKFSEEFNTPNYRSSLENMFDFV